MRVFTIGMWAIALSASAGIAYAQPVDLLCEVGGSPASAVHLYVDPDARTISWLGQQYPATVTATQVSWTGTENLNPHVGMHFEGTLDLSTGAMSTYSGGAADSQTGQRWSAGRMNWMCAKATNILH